MSITVQNESVATAEAVEVLMEHLPASKVARLMSTWQLGQGDYVALRNELFRDETVESLCSLTCSASPAASPTTSSAS